MKTHHHTVITVSAEPSLPPIPAKWQTCNGRHLGALDQPTPQLNTLKSPVSKLLGAEVPSRVLPKFLSHKVMRYYKMGSFKVFFYPAIYTWTRVQC